MELLKKAGVFLACITLLLFMNGCRDELVIRDFQVDSETYQQEGHFIGNTKVEFDVDLTVDNDDYIFHWTASGGRFLSQGESSVEYVTPRMPGDYNIRLVVRDDDGNEITYNFPFSVVGNYPDPVNLFKSDNITYEQGVNLEWTAAEEDDFYSYQILRSNNIYIDNNAEVIKEIYDQEQTSYTDFDIDPNEKYSYQIILVNDDGYLSLSNEKMVEILAPGIQSLEFNHNLSDLIVDNQREQAYILKEQYNKLLVIDLYSLEIINELKLNSGARDLLVTEDKEYLFIVNDGNDTISRLELDSLTYQDFGFDAEIVDLSLDKDYLYLLARDKENNIKKLDIETMELIDEYNLSSSKIFSFRKIEVFDGRYLLADEKFGDTLIYDLDDNAALIDSFSTGPINDVKVFSNDDGYEIFLTSRNFDYIQVFQFYPTDKLKKKGIADTKGYPSDFVIDKSKDLILATHDGKEVFIFSSNDYRLLDTVNLQNYAYNIDLFFDQQKVYTLTSNISANKSGLTVIDLEKYLTY